MADGSISFTSGSEYVIFSHCGKTMIGKFYKNAPTVVNADGGVHKTLGVSGSNYYYVANPAELVFNLVIPSSGSADLKWEIKPVFYPDLVASTNTNYSDIIFTYPKESVALCSIGGTVINGTILDAYKELCE